MHTISFAEQQITDSSRTVQGHALYYGRGNLADEYFDKLGYTLPYRVNVADFILDLSSADVYTESRYCTFLMQHPSGELD